ncbi:hypothetical protein P148_SR1C00001G0655 [candidate division SR1 bacterium RAAC1_SR1_1]|nr:hypothetical protein P148_SR1C00001G0655 [candidate division SR1 bacterium RAAC1_SR1_1]
MYKRFSLAEVKSIQNNFIQNLYSNIKKERCLGLMDFFKKIFRDGSDIYYCNRTEVNFSCSKTEKDIIILRDEKEKIEVILDEENKKELHNIIKNFIIKKEKQFGQKTIEQILMDEFTAGGFNIIDGKPYLVYDIETTISDDIKNAKFLLGYAMYPAENNKMQYDYIDQDNLAEFVQKMIDFDGYIIGYNNIWFDNPVCVYNCGGTQEHLNEINRKSIDLFVLLYKLTGKRLGLNKVATALVGIQKTLESGLEGETLWKKYQETNDQKYLEEFKAYCKNDVRMTALLMLYLLHFKKIFIEGEEKSFDDEDFLKLSNSTEKEVKEVSQQATSLF